MLTAERRLAADASHQLRTPLTALSMRLEEITVTDDLDTVKEEATIALTQVERLTDVVERLLTNSRDPRTGSAVAFDLDEVIKQQLEEWRPAYRSAGRADRAVRASTALRAVGTPGAVAQVLAALIENSLMHGGGTVALRTRVTGNQAVVEVTDEGPGVPPELGARIFERTHQRPQLHRDRPCRGPRPGGGGRRTAGAAPAEAAGLRSVPEPGGEGRARRAGRTWSRRSLTRSGEVGSPNEVEVPDESGPAIG